MGEAYIKKTQDSLGKLIKKPPMTEKLLKKPPFRFLHDIFTEVIRTTGFMKGLYTDSEMDSLNVKDKDAKIAFLQKAIDVVAMVSGQSLSVRPSKIVAGHEPEKTNEFLQALGMALTKKLDSTDSVKKVLNGEKTSSGKPPRPKKDEEKKGRETSGDKRHREKDNKEKKSSSDNRDRSGSRDREKEDRKNRDHSKDRESKDRDSKDRSSKDRERSKHRDRSKDKEERSRSKDKEKERSRDKEKDKEKSRDKEKERERDKDKDREKDREKEKEERDRERKERRRRKDEEAASKLQTQNDDDESDDTEDLRPAAPETEDGASGNRIPRPSSAKGMRRRPTKDSDEPEGRQESAKQRPKHRKEEGGGGGTEDDGLPPQVTAGRKMARPSSARPAPPRLKKQESLEDGSRIGSGKQVSNVIVDNAHNSDDDDDTFVVEDSQQSLDDEPRPMASESMEDDGEHGGLVKKILETKKELEGTQNKQDDKPVTLDPARRKERELVQREVERLRTAIQTLTRSANPLGKIMDYLQEDVDSMQKELEMWQRENKEHALAIKREQGITDSELEPLKAQLAELDQGMADQLDAIAAIKSTVMRNDEKITKMVSSIAFNR